MEKEKKCTTCKKEKLDIKEWGFIVLGFYMCFAGIYGTIQLIKNYILN